MIGSPIGMFIGAGAFDVSQPAITDLIDIPLPVDYVLARTAADYKASWKERRGRTGVISRKGYTMKSSVRRIAGQRRRSTMKIVVKGRIVKDGA